MNLTTLERVRGYMTFKADNTADDPLLSRLIVQASSAIEQFLERHVEEKQRTEAYDAESGHAQIYLTGTPVDMDQTFEVKEDTDYVFGSDTVIPSTDYLVNKNSGLLFFHKAVLLGGRQTVRVKYTGGMAADVVEFIQRYPDIALACEMQVAFLYKHRPHTGLSNISVAGGGSTTFATDGKEAAKGILIPEVKAACRPWKRAAYLGKGVEV